MTEHRSRGGGDPNREREPSVADVVAAVPRDGQRHQPLESETPFWNLDLQPNEDPAELIKKIPRRSS